MRIRQHWRNSDFPYSVPESSSGFVLDINGGARRPFSAAFLGVGCDFSVSPDDFPDRDPQLLFLHFAGFVILALVHILLTSSDFASTLFERMVQLLMLARDDGYHDVIYWDPQNFNGTFPGFGLLGFIFSWITIPWQPRHQHAFLEQFSCLWNPTTCP